MGTDVVRAARRRQPGRDAFSGTLSATTLRWWSGAFCVFLGAFMIVVPNRFSGPAYSALRHVPLWGLAFLVAGWAMLAVAAVRPRQSLQAVAHALVALTLLLFAGGLAAGDAWSGTLAYGLIAVGVVAAAGLPAHRAERRSGDLLALLMGLTMVLVGAGLVLFAGVMDPVVYILSEPWLRGLGAALLLAGPPLAWVQLRPLPAAGLAAVHALAGLVLLAVGLAVMAPTRAWTGVAFYGSGGIVVALLPWLRWRLRRFDPGSLSTRLALVLAAAASLPLILTLALVEGADPALHQEHRGRAFVLLLLVVALAVTVGTAAARRLARPLQRLARAADRLAAGEPAVPLETFGVTEVDRLTLAFRRMRLRLDERSAEAERLARELRSRAEELVEDDRRKDEFLAMLAHELRNPLGAVDSAAHVLAEQSGADPALERPVQVIRRQTGHLTRLVDDLLDISRITRGKVELQRRRVDLVALVRGSLDAAEPQLRDAGLDLEADLSSGPVPVMADATRLEQVLGNLLSNAAKYTGEGGRVAVSVERRDGEAVVRVSDTGVGMSAQLLERVFELFAQGERSLDRGSGGLGIGLTLVRRLVEMHGGRVRAHSDGPDRGSEFVVHLPVAP